MITAKCKVCEEEIPVDTGFYANDKTCKECRKAKVRDNRARRAEYYREYDRRRFKEDPRVAERHRRYMATKSGKEAAARSNKKFLENNPIKRAAHILVGNYVRDGKLQKPKNCESCGIFCESLHGHHDDYAKPLDVRWLCSACHRAWHKENGSGANAH